MFNTYREDINYLLDQYGISFFPDPAIFIQGIYHDIIMTFAVRCRETDCGRVTRE